jgi:hypothetical protein
LAQQHSAPADTECNKYDLTAVQLFLIGPSYWLVQMVCC